MLSRKLSIFLILLFTILLSSCRSTPLPAGSGGGDYSQASRLEVPVKQFLSSLKTTRDLIRAAYSFISNYTGFFGDFRLRNAVTDCLDLLDFSADELSWTMSASTNPRGKNNSTGDSSADMRTWLSAALVNQDTCMEGFDGTDSSLRSLVRTALGKITSRVHELLTMAEPSSKSKSKSTQNGLGGNSESNKFPSWVANEERKLLLVKRVTPNVIVAADGTGNFTKIMDAIAAAPDYSKSRFIIYVKKGVYNEYVEIKKKKWNIMMVGDGMGVTIITGNRNYVDGWTTFRSATFGVSGRGFIAQDITFENTAGPAKHQAVALRSDSDLSVYFRCEIKGYQDSLYTHAMRQFFRECRISGTVDFIFGDATAVFQNCQILARRGLPKQKNTITAHGRKNPSQPTGYTIQFCNITADSDLLPYINSTHTYLGRPWKNYSRTVVMQSHISDLVRPEGWLEWEGDMYLDTLYYAEYLNSGAGARLAKRVKWPGYHIFNASYQSNNYTVAQFLDGNLWLPSTGVRYTAGLEF